VCTVNDPSNDGLDVLLAFYLSILQANLPCARSFNKEKPVAGEVFKVLNGVLALGSIIAITKNRHVNTRRFDWHPDSLVLKR
jgi:hypothetical protein